MTDREQIRRDARALIAANPGVEIPENGYDEVRFADACLDLLAELEQAEEKLDFGMDASQVAVLVLRHREAEARLAKVPALVEAAKQSLSLPTAVVNSGLHEKLRAALAAWEQT